MDQYDIHEPVVSVVTGVEFPVVAELNNPPCLSLSLWIPVVSREELVSEAHRSKQRLISPPPQANPPPPCLLRQTHMTSPLCLRVQLSALLFTYS